MDQPSEKPDQSIPILSPISPEEQNEASSVLKGLLYQPLGQETVFETDTANRVKTKGRVHWLYPTLMAFSLLAAVLFSIGHHFFYHYLDGRVVGSTTKQQWSLRIGNGFAGLVSFFLKIAVGVAYTQYLWSSLRQNSISLNAINDAFNLRNDILSFVNWELLSKIRIGVVVAIIFWSLPLTSVFAPATLSVTQTLSNSFTTIEVPNIGISNGSLVSNFLAYQRINQAPPQGSSLLARIIGTVAMSGQQQLFQAPSSHPNISYQLQTYVPLLKCSSDNSTAQSQLISMLIQASNIQGTSTPGTNEDVNPLGGATNLTTQVLNNQTFEWENEDGISGAIGYFGVMPIYTVDTCLRDESATTCPSDVQSIIPWYFPTQLPLDMGDVMGLLAGQILMAILVASSNTSSTPQMEFINCQLYNSSLTFNVNFTNHVSNITVVENKWMNDLYSSDLYPVAFEGDSSSPIFSYFAYLCSIGMNLFGSVSWWSFLEAAQFIYENNIQMMNTFLATSAQVYDMDQKIHYQASSDSFEGFNGSSLPARNISFAQDVENFALNSTLSILADLTLCDYEMADVTITTTETVYLYDARNLIIVYSCLLVASAVAVLFGAFSFVHNGESYDTNVSTFAMTMQNPEMAKVLSSYSSAIQPLDEDLGRVKLRFVKSEGFIRGDSGGTFLAK